MPRDVTAAGVLNIDLFIRGDGPPDWDSMRNWAGPSQIEMTVAGALGYTVNNLARLGLAVRGCACLPDDVMGAFIQDSLGRAGIDMESVRLIPKTSGGIAVYMLLFGSRKRPLTYQLPTHPFWPLEFSPDEIETLLDTRLLHHGGYLHYKEGWHGTMTALFKEAKSRGIITTMDPQFPVFPMEPPWIVALEDILPQVDVFLCDEDEARSIAAQNSLHDAARRIIDSGVGTVVIKQGEAGSTVYRDNRRIHQRAILPGEEVDTIGAGDAYNAGFIYGILEGWPQDRCALFAAVCAGFSVTGAGGSASVPVLDRVIEEMEKTHG